MTRNTPVIVTFIGPVGVGKSTQSRLLSKYFRKRGQKVVDTYLRSAHGTSYLITVILKRVQSQKSSNIGNNSLTGKSLEEKFATFWNISDSINILVKFLLTVYIPYVLGYNVLIEEGIFMSIENFRLFRPKLLGVKATTPLLLDIILRWTNAHRNLYIILDAGDDEVVKRRRTRVFRRSESADFVLLQRKAMSELVGRDVLRINTSEKSIEEVNKMIVKYIEKNEY